MNANPPHLLPDLLRVRALKAATGVAIQEIGSGRTSTWSECLQESLRWAAAFEAVGVRAGATVLSMLPNSIDAYYCWLGAAWLKAMEVPINTAHRGRMLQYMLANSDARVLVVADRYLPQIQELDLVLENVDLVIVPDSAGSLPDLACPVISGEQFLSTLDSIPDRPGPQAHDIATIIYTSGTTGPSKGVLVPWGELWVFADHTAPDMIQEGGAYYSPYSPYHISGKTALLNAAAYNCRLVLRESFSASSFWSDIREHGCTSAMILGPMATILLAAPERPDDADTPLRTVSLGPLPPDLEGFKRRFGVDVMTAYGTTEIGLPLTSGWDISNSRTCGRVKPGYPGYEVRVVNEFDQPLGPGEVGELIVRASEPWSMCTGYFQMPDKSAEAWRNGWFHTGDAFQYDEDGWFYFVDRMKDTIRRRGENISSFEVEACVNEHPSVAESVAIAVPSELGEDELLVLVILKPGEAADPDGLIDFLEASAPRFMIPRYLEFVDDLPRTEATHRVRKVELRGRGLTPATWDRQRSQAAGR